MNFIIKYEKYIAPFIYSLVGYTMATVGCGLTSWQFWAVIPSMLAVDVMSRIKGLDDGWDIGFKRADELWKASKWNK